MSFVLIWTPFLAPPQRIPESQRRPLAITIEEQDVRDLWNDICVECDDSAARYAQQLCYLLGWNAPGWEDEIMMTEEC